MFSGKQVLIMLVGTVLAGVGEKAFAIPPDKLLWWAIVVGLMMAAGMLSVDER